MKELDREGITKARRAIREHRDQTGDYRCWVDDEVLYYRTLPELAGKTPPVPAFEDFMTRCKGYHEKRQDPAELPQEIALDSSKGPLELTYDEALDRDLVHMSESDLARTLEVLLTGIREHRSRGYRDRTFEDDKALYLLLPEKKVAVTQLPPYEDFIGKNCPAYAEFCQKNPSRFLSGTWERR